MRYKKKKNLRTNITKGLSLSLLATAILSGCDSSPSTPTTNPGSIQLESTSYTATEGVATVTITATRTGGSDGAASVDYTTADGTATSIGDYTTISGTLNWADGETAAKTFDINISDDSVAEWNTTESFNVSLSNATTASLGANSSATVTIDDNDSSLSFSNTSYTVSEGTASVSIVVSRSGVIDSSATVDIATSDGTATATNDYTTTSQTITWNSGEGGNKTVNIPIIDDNEIDPSESFTVTLSNPSTNAEIISGSSATVNIADVVAYGSISLTSSSFTATEGTDTTITVTASRTGGADGAVSVDYAATDGTATSGDYSLTAGTINWAAGDTANKTFDITVTDDSTTELDETLTIDLTNVSAATLGSTTSATVTISDNDGVAVTGTVSAPSGNVAFNGPTFFDKMFAMLFGKSAHALIGDLVSAVPSGTTVSIYEVDETGATVGTAITTAATDSLGTYVLATPAFDAKYIVRASGSGKLDSRVVGATVDVDPVTDAASELITTVTTDAAKLAALNLEEILVIQDEISNLVEEIDTTGAPTAADIVTKLKSAAQNDEEISNVVSSTVASGEICGTVTNASSSGLESIVVVARDFDDWVTRAKAKTKTDGSYCMNLPEGDYIVGAINRTGDTKDPNRSASEWYTAAGGVSLQINAEKVTVGSTTLTLDFELSPGIRIKGTVLGNGGTFDGQGIEGGRVVIRDSDSNFSVASARVKDDGSYRINIAPGKYRIGFRNVSTKPYASQYNTTVANAAFDNNLLYGTVYDLSGEAAGSYVHTVDFTPSVGYQLTGTITEGGNPVAGPRVFVRDAVNGGVNNVLRSKKDGTFRIWLRPSTYNVYSYGQRDEGIDMTASDYAVSFTADVAVQPVVVKHGTTPVSQAKVDVYDSAGKFLARSGSNSDGTTNLFSSDPLGDTSHKVVIRIDTEENYGSIVYDGQTVFSSGTNVVMNPAAAAPTSFDIVLPDGGTLKTVVTEDGTTPATNIPVQVRDGGTSGGFKFVTNRTRGDGISYLSLPGNTGSSRTYNAVRVNGSAGANCTGIPIENGKTTTLTFRTDTKACSFTGPS